MLSPLPVVSFGCLLSVMWPLQRLWQTHRHTALHSTCLWVFITAGAWILLSGCGLVESDTLQKWTGLLRQFATTLLLTPIVAVLGARWPGAGAWNLVILCLVAVLAIPGVQDLLLNRQSNVASITLDGPRFTIHAIIALVGVINYLPTRFGAAALVFGAGVTLQLVASGPWELHHVSMEMLENLAGIMLGCTAWASWGLRRSSNPTGFDAEWLAFRDSWGLAWSSRVRDRWNAAARHYGWKLYLGWTGLKCNTAAGGSVFESVEASETAVEQLRLLLRRFVEPRPATDFENSVSENRGARRRTK